MSPRNAVPGTSPSDIAVVGAGCRFPGGADDLESYWELLRSGRTVLGPVPADRWGPEFHGPGPGRIGSATGGFLSDVDRFDAEFFGISPREAREMDPQQRLLIEVAWEAVEDAGIPRDRLTGSRTGVFAGILAPDYTVLHAKLRTPAEIDPYYATGKEFSFGAGRIAYTFDLHGPVMTVNSACSSSLVSVHLAAQALRAGDCDTALAGGVNVIVAPELSVFMSTVQAFSPTGQCRPFDAAASGVIRGEGCGLVVLKRYADAVAAGDRVLAVLCGSAVNHDGHSAGLTVPSGPAQEDLLRSALAAAGLAAGEVDYVEAHGTGTPLGDPIEVAALSAVLGRDRPAGRPLLLGSHKANLGHLDSAAGIAGLLKVIGVVRHRVAPPQARLDTLTPHVDWARSGLHVPTAEVPLPETGRAAVAGVNAFGLSGTNAHVLVAAPPEDVPVGAGRVLPLVLSAPTADGLRRRAQEVADRLSAGKTADTADRPSAGEAADAADRSSGGKAAGGLPAVDAADLAWTAAVRRTAHAHRLAVTGDPAAGLAAYLAGTGGPDVVTGVRETAAPRPVLWAFSGQGAQWPRMGVDLYDAEPVVRATLDECDALLADVVGWSLLDRLRAAAPAVLRATEVAQPAVFALQVALARLWRSWGVTPAAVVGHSMGEVAAAHVAGVLDLPAAVRLIAHRGRLLQAATGTGRMLAVELPAADLPPHLAGTGVVVATVNGPASTVLAGPAEEVAAVARRLAAAGVTATPLPVDYAFHSPLVAAYGDELEALLGDLRPAEPTVPLLSSVRPGAPVTGDAAYWGDNVREPVLLWPAVEALLATADPAIVEIGPHPTLGRPLAAGVRAASRTGPVLASLRRDRPGPAVVQQALAALFAAGVPVDWAAAGPRRVVPMPRHPWRDDRFWLAGVERGQQTALARPADLRAEVRLIDPTGRVVTTLTTTAVTSADGVPVRPVPAAGGPTPGVGTSGSPPSAGPAPGPGGSRDQVLAGVRAVVADLLGWDSPARLPVTRGFFELGVDSLSAVELARRVERRFGCTLGDTVAFDFPSVTALADHLTTLVTAGSASLPDRTPGASGPDPAPGPADPRSADASTPVEVRPAATPAGAGEPIAIVGLACRLPGGADSPDRFWDLLHAGRDASSELPADRWDAAGLLGTGDLEPGQVSTTRGSFLDGIDGFDAAFFRVSPTEARSMDPQQRIFLETAYEAIEDAGLVPERLRDRSTGVFVGLNTTDYQQLLTRRPQDVDLYYGTGNSFSGTAGRLSYFLGVRGPSLAVDTACSSSLTAVHLACQSLRSGESHVAIAGGANVIATPTVYLAMSAGGALSPDGRCKAFAAEADGYGRGEGVGVVVLKTLASARADGDRVYAVIRGSAVNADGASGGFTVPSGEAQAEVVRSALGRAGLRPADVDYVEAHGTGTPLGDPIELRALGSALGADRAAPLVVGSVKTNIGHLEAAAGVAGLLKVVLALRHGEIPAHLHAGRPTGRIAWDQVPLRLATEPVPWVRNGRRRAAGVSAFGFTGTNAHVVVTEADLDATAPAARTARALVLPVSAASAPALAAAARRLGDHVSTLDDRELVDAVHTAGARRSHREHRAVAVGRTPAELADQLESIAEGTVPTGRAAGRRLALVLGDTPGDLPWAELMRTEPAFAAAAEAADAALREFTGRSVLAGPAGDGVDRLRTFVLQVGLAALWPALGLVPDVVAGYGAGEAAAWYVGGRADLRAAARHLVGLNGTEPEAAGDRPTYTAADPAALRDRLATDGVDALLAVGTRLRLEDAELIEAGSREPVETVAAAYLAGCAVDWPALNPAGRVVSLPGYPWQHRSYWVDTPAPAATGHPYLGPVLRPADRPGVAYREVTGPDGSAGVLVEALVAAGRAAAGDGPVRVRGLAVRAPLAATQATVERDGPGWQVRLRAGHRVAAEATVDLPPPGGCPAPGGDASGTVTLRVPGEPGPYALRAEVVDAATTLVAGDRDAVLTAVAEIRVEHMPAGALTLTATGPDVVVTDAAGQVCATLLGLELAGTADLTLSDERRAELAAVLHTVRWVPVDPPAPAAEPGRWLVLPDAGPLADEVAAELTARGAEVTRRAPAAPDDSTLRDRLAEDGGRWDGIVLAVDGGDPAATVLDLAATDAGRVWTVTAGAHDPAPVPGPAVAWALGRVLAAERPDRHGGLVDVPAAEAGRGGGRAAVAALLGDRRNDQLRVSAGTWTAARLVPLPVEGTRLPARLRSGWIAAPAGLGPAAAPFLDLLVEQGAHRLLVTEPADPAETARLRQLRAAGVEVRPVAPDTLLAAVTGLVADRDLTGVLLAVPPAPVRPLETTGPAELAADAARADLAEQLDRATRTADLDLFVLVGSAAPAWGAVGSAVTAPADARLAAVAAGRAADGLTGQLVALMPRTDTGELDDRNRALMEGSGLTPLTADAVRSAADHLLRTGTAAAHVAVVDRAAYAEVCRRTAPRSFFAELAGAPAAPAAAPLLAELAAAAPAGREDLLVDRLLAEVAGVLGRAADDVEPDQGFFELGMDSVMSLRLATRVGRLAGTELPATLTFEFPTTRALARHLLAEAEPPSRPDDPVDPDDPDDDLDRLTDDELLRRLDAALDGPGALLPADQVGEDSR